MRTFKTFLPRFKHLLAV